MLQEINLIEQFFIAIYYVLLTDQHIQYAIFGELNYAEIIRGSSSP